MGTIRSGKFPSTLVNPKVFPSARLRLLWLAVSSGLFNHFSQPLAFLYGLLQPYIPAVRSTFPKNRLPERSPGEAIFQLFLQTTVECKTFCGSEDRLFSGCLFETKIS